MPVTLGQLARNRAQLTIPGDGGDLHVTYRPQAITPRVRAALRYSGADAANLPPDEMLEVLGTITAFLASMLIDWDLEYPDAEGQPSGRKIPPTLEGLQDVDYEVQGMVLGAIMEAVSLGESNGARSLTPSASPSSRAARRAISRHHSPTGTR